jgi:glycosyltransferase involved in cell wall biosynthesis
VSSAATAQAASTGSHPPWHVRRPSLPKRQPRDPTSVARALSSQYKRSTSMDLSIVVPAFNEAESLPLLYARVRDALCDQGLIWELIVVDDGSTDDTFDVVSELHAGDARVHGLGLSRNFGHQLALFAGLQAARGRAVITLDADLQYPPEVIGQLVAKWRDGAAIVHTIRHDTPSVAPWTKRLSSRLFYWVFRKLSGLDLWAGMADFRLYDRRVVDVIVASADPSPFFRGFAAWVGFRQAEVRFEGERRLHGQSRYTLGKMLQLAASGVVGFSSTPLYGSLFVGLLGLVVSLAYGGYAVLAYLLGSASPPGWKLLVALFAVVSSLQFVMLGILGLYVSEISQAVRARPSVVVARSTPGATSRPSPRVRQA